jgi:hypothetical protein
MLTHRTETFHRLTEGEHLIVRLEREGVREGEGEREREREKESYKNVGVQYKERLTFDLLIRLL